MINGQHFCTYLYCKVQKLKTKTNTSKCSGAFIYQAIINYDNIFKTSETVFLFAKEYLRTFLLISIVNIFMHY